MSEFVKHKVSDLLGAQLDAAVALANGWTEWKEYGLHDGYPVWQTGDVTSPTYSLFKPSLRWECAGPIIDREHIALRHCNSYPPEQPEACVAPGSDYDTFVPGRASYATGPTILVAAMRAYVISKLGEEIELP